MWITSTRTPQNPLPQRSKVSLACLFLAHRSDKPPSPATQLPPPSPPPVLPTRQATDEATPLLGSRTLQPTAQPRRHTITTPHAHGLVLGHHRHEPPRQHERHYVDHPRCGLTQFSPPEDIVEEDPATAKASPVRDHHVADYQQSRRYQSHSHGLPHHSHGDMESLLDTPDLDAETGSDADDAEIKIGRKRQIIGILVRFTYTLLPHGDNRCFAIHRFCNWALCFTRSSSGLPSRSPRALISNRS